MSFRVEEPLRHSDLERLRCPDCKMRFWSVDAFVREQYTIVAAVGAFPADAKRME